MSTDLNESSDYDNDTSIKPDRSTVDEPSKDTKDSKDKQNVHKKIGDYIIGTYFIFFNTSHRP